MASDGVVLAMPVVNSSPSTPDILGERASDDNAYPLSTPTQFCLLATPYRDESIQGVAN
ncbi:hypothetical protein XM38_042120 [Halomicronema hongdechloris C2206]|uniref:Uncharacterized protein n=1 Tax=Halomicronema hongdechloris C2206 TaxID=1641165 RepID=A0A1Z3HSF9_9CYAN|nr:hypothetical protein [Halomicronema hongdechloris]ASC73250.1 hypothetical protein XM38_042120 [Halomicronema hongdechloris C2206]